MTAQSTDTSYLWPARHEAGSAANPNLPPMGARFRLKSTFNISGYSADAQVVLRALQQYGLIVADNGSNWYFQGTADNAWPPSLIAELKTIPASAFEAVDESSLEIDPNSGAARQPVSCTASADSYRMVAADGGIFSYCAGFYGSMGGRALNAPIVGMADTPSSGGYWLVAADGGVFSFGDALYSGSTGGQHLNAPVVGMAAGRAGYWLVAADGGVFSYGGAGFYGSMGGKHLNSPIVGMTATPDGGGYWLVAADGGVFAFGDALFHGSLGGTHLVRPIVGIESSQSGHGYWLVAADGGVFSYGDANFYGSLGGAALTAPSSGCTRAPTATVTGCSAPTAGCSATATRLSWARSAAFTWRPRWWAVRPERRTPEPSGEIERADHDDDGDDGGRDDPAHHELALEGDGRTDLLFEGGITSEWSGGRQRHVRRTGFGRVHGSCSIARVCSAPLPTFSVFSQRMSAWRSSLMYEEKATAHSSGP